MTMGYQPDFNTALVMFDGAMVWIGVTALPNLDHPDYTPRDPKYWYTARIEGVMPFGGRSDLVITEGIRRCETEEEAYANGFMAVLTALRRMAANTVRL